MPGQKEQLYWTLLCSYFKSGKLFGWRVAEEEKKKPKTIKFPFREEKTDWERLSWKFENKVLENWNQRMFQIFFFPFANKQLLKKIWNSWNKRSRKRDRSTTQFFSSCKPIFHRKWEGQEARALTFRVSRSRDCTSWPGTHPRSNPGNIGSAAFPSQTCRVRNSPADIVWPPRPDRRTPIPSNPFCRCSRPPRRIHDRNIVDRDSPLDKKYLVS